MPPRGDARIREREAQRAAEAAEKATEGEEDLDFEEFGIDGLGCNWDRGIVIVVDWGVRICRLGYAGPGQVVGRRKHGFIRLDDHSTRKNAGRLLLQTPVE